MVDSFVGAVLGMAIGDALGFPLRGVPARAIASLPELAEDFSPRPRGRFQKGQFSDDTQLMLALMESVARERKVDGRSAASHFAWLWREGVLLQPAPAVADSIGRLLEGVPWMSAGAPVGVADPSCLSRALVVGLWHQADAARLAHDAAVVTVITHRDGQCAAAAAAYAAAVALAFEDERRTPQLFCEAVAAAASVHDERLAAELRHLPRVLGWEEDRALELLRRVAVPTALLGLGDGLPAHAAPALLTALYVVLKVPHDFRAAMRLVLRAGGEVDVAACLVGGLLGAHLGLEALPPRLRKGVAYPEQLEATATKLASARAAAHLAPARAAARVRHR